MDTLLILLASLSTAFLAARLSGRRAFNLADLAVGLFAGAVSIGFADVLGTAAAPAGLAWSLFLACTLALGLESLPFRSSPR